MIRLALESEQDAIDLNGILAEGYGVQAIAGLTGFGLPPVTPRWIEGAGDGSVWRGSRTNARIIDLPLYVDGRSRAELIALVDRLSLMFAGEFRLVAIDSDGTRSFLTCVRSGGGDYVYGQDTTGEDTLEWVVTLTAGDPFWTTENTSSRVAQLSEVSGGLLPELSKLQLSSLSTFSDMALTNTGTAPSFPVFKVEGPCTGFSLQSPRGEVVEWKGVLAANKSLVVDMAKGTVVDDSGVSKYAGLAPAPRFWSLAPGVNSAVISVENPAAPKFAAGAVLQENQFTNPSFEGVSGSADLWRNLMVDPRGVSTAIWAGWAGGVANSYNTVTRSSVAAAWSQAGVAMRTTWTSVVPGYENSGDIAATFAGSLSGLEGKTVTAVARTVVSRQGMQLNTPTMYGASGSIEGIVARGRTTNVQPAPGEIVEDWVTFVVPSPIPSNLRLLNSVWQKQSGDYAEMSMGDLYEGPYRPYRQWASGANSPDPDFLVRWEGTPDASPSVVYAPLAAGVTSSVNSPCISSTGWAEDGTRSLRVVPTVHENRATFAAIGGDLGAMRLGMVAGETYTIAVWCRLAAPLVNAMDASRRIQVMREGYVQFAYSEPAPNEPGVHLIRLTFTVPATATNAFVRAHLGTSPGNGEIWFDNFTIVKGDIPDLMPFSGATRGTQSIVYRWAGAMNASPSQMCERVRVSGTRVEAIWPERNRYLI